MREKAERLKQKVNAVSWQDKVKTRTPHDKQRAFIDSPAKRKVIRAGRRGGKTTGIAIAALEAFKAGRRVLYAAPTEDQVGTFWFEIKQALNDLCDAGVLVKNETKHTVEVPGTKNRIRAKTAWNADTLRGDYADLLILDEFQLMAEDTWGVVGAPMLMDNNGDAVFIYTPLSLATKTRTKARDPKHAAKMYAKADADETGLWAAFHFTSMDNPHNTAEAIDIIASDMTRAAFQQEILAEDATEVPGALWKQALIDELRRKEVPALTRIVIGVDPPGSVNTECGIVCAGLGADGHVYVLDDTSLFGSPDAWSNAVIDTYDGWQADRVLGEKNFGGDMVEHTIRSAEGGKNISYKNVNASRGKAVRAEPVAALYERGRVHHVGEFPMLEAEMTGWIPNAGMLSPNRCFPAGTLIAVPTGDKPIEEIRAGDYVCTQSGYQKVLASALTSPCSSLLQLTLSCGIILECTPNHPIYVLGRGFVPAWTIKKSDQVAVLASRLSNSTELNIGATQTAPASQQRDTSIPTSTATVPMANNASMLRFGNSIMALYQKGRISITKTKVLITTIYQTLKWLLASNMGQGIGATRLTESAGKWPMLVTLPQNGMEVPTDYNGILSTVSRLGKGANHNQPLSVLNAGQSTLHFLGNGGRSGFAHEPASTDTTNELNDMQLSEPALFAETLLRLIALQENSKLVPVSVLGSCAVPDKPVYNLTVETEHHYFANGVLVHNCDALVWAVIELVPPGGGFRFLNDDPSDDWDNE